jgi:hypothetical protein
LQQGFDPYMKNETTDGLQFHRAPALQEGGQNGQPSIAIGDDADAGRMTEEATEDEVERGYDGEDEPFPDEGL